MAASVPEYGRQSYWEARHRSERDFDWYLVDFPRISPLLGAYASQSHSIFEAGCGTSTLARDLYDNGYGKVTAVDYSRSAVDAQRAAQGGDGRRPGLSYELADLRRYVPESPPPSGCPCRARPFVATSSRRARRRLGTPPRRATADAAPAPSSPPPNRAAWPRLAAVGNEQFDVVIDKATLDAIDDAGEDGGGAPSAAAEYLRVLKTGGKCIVITCRDPARRLEDFPRSEYLYLEHCELGKEGGDTTPDRVHICILEKVQAQPGPPLRRTVLEADGTYIRRDEGAGSRLLCGQDPDTSWTTDDSDLDDVREGGARELHPATLAALHAHLGAGDSDMDCDDLQAAIATGAVLAGRQYESDSSDD